MTESANGTASVMDTPPVPDIRTSAICLNVEFSVLGNSKRANLELVETDADKSALSLSKKLIDSDELDALRALKTSIRNYLAAQAIHSHLKPGLWLIPLAKVQQVDEALVGYSLLWDDAVERLIAMYPTRIAEAPERLKSQHSALDYLNTSAEGWERSIREKCTLNWSYVEMDTPTRLRSISRAIFEREQQKAADEWEYARQAAQQVLRLEVAGMLDELAGKMTSEKKRLQQRYMDKCQEWIASFRDGKYAITQDDELQALVTDWERLLTTNDATALRSNEALRQEVATQIGAIREQLGTMLETAPTRHYSLVADITIEESDHDNR